MLEMLGAVVSGLAAVFSWSTFSLMMIGIVVGIMFAILPGLRGPTTLALMLPFFFKINAVAAFVFFIGMSAVFDLAMHIPFPPDLRFSWFL